MRLSVLVFGLKDTSECNEFEIFNFHFQFALSVLLQRLPTGKPILNVVPPFNPIAFVGLPTEQDHAAVTHGRKIDQPLVIILQLNTEAVELSRKSRKPDEQACVTRTFSKTTAATFSADGRLFSRGLKGNQSPVRLLNGFYDGTDAG